LPPGFVKARVSELDDARNKRNDAGFGKTVIGSAPGVGDASAMGDSIYQQLSVGRVLSTGDSIGQSFAFVASGVGRSTSGRPLLARGSRFRTPVIAASVIAFAVLLIRCEGPFESWFCVVRSV